MIADRKAYEELRDLVLSGELFLKKSLTRLLRCARIYNRNSGN